MKAPVAVVSRSQTSAPPASTKRSPPSLAFALHRPGLQAWALAEGARHFARGLPVGGGCPGSSDALELSGVLLSLL